MLSTAQQHKHHTDFKIGPMQRPASSMLSTGSTCNLYTYNKQTAPLAKTVCTQATSDKHTMTSHCRTPHSSSVTAYYILPQPTGAHKLVCIPTDFKSFALPLHSCTNVSTNVHMCEPHGVYDSTTATQTRTGGRAADVRDGVCSHSDCLECRAYTCAHKQHLSETPITHNQSKSYSHPMQAAQPSIPYR